MKTTKIILPFLLERKDGHHFIKLVNAALYAKLSEDVIQTTNYDSRCT